MARLALAKLHGLGNDFLVLIDWADRQRLGPATVRALCDRRHGVGADGILRALAPRDGGDVRMELANADGTPAEMSGNGIRCLVVAILDAGLLAGPVLTVETAAGPRRVTVHPDGAMVSVAMGRVRLGPETASPLAGRRACRASVGNPHLVLLGAPEDGADIRVVGPRLERAHPGGVNVELVAPDRAGGLVLAVWERGAGVTRACGTGSCAAAAAARRWGVVGPRVLVRNPGGVLRVDLAGEDLDAPDAILTGPVRRVATVEVELGDLTGPGDPAPV